MRIGFICLLTLFIPCRGFFLSAKTGPFNRLHLPDGFVFVPAGNLGDSAVNEFYISATEVSNSEYRLFIQDLVDSGATELARMAVPDTLRWADSAWGAAAFCHNYYSAPAFAAYPVVNVTPRAARFYCEWLAQRYRQTGRRQARFALPTETQWMWAAMGGDTKALYPWPGKSLVYTQKGKYKGTAMANYHVDQAPGRDEQQAEQVSFTAPSRSYMPNTYDIYNMGGNVAEMIEGATFTKGGSFNSRAAQLLISAREEYDTTKASPCVGFRPVLMFTEKEKRQ